MSELIPKCTLRGHDGNADCICTEFDRWGACESVNPDCPVRGHSNTVFSIAFSPIGDVLASGSKDKTIRIWDVKSGKELGSVTGHSGPVSCMVIGQDVLVSGSWDKTIRRWNLKTGEQIGSPLKGHSDSVCSIATLGNVVASGSSDKTVQLWDISNGNPAGCPHIQGENVSALAASSNKLAVAVGANVKLHATPQARVQRVQHFLTCTCMDKSYSTCHAVCTLGQ